MRYSTGNRQVPASGKSDRLRGRISKAYQSGSHSAALRHCDKYLALVPDDIQILPLAGLLAVQLGESDRAYKFFLRQRAALDKQDSTNAPAYFTLGLALEELDRFKDALGALERALELDPENLDYLSKRAGLLELEGDLDQALLACENILARANDHSATQAILGIVLQKRNDHAGAVKAYKSALLAAPDLVHIYNNLAMGLLQTGNGEELSEFCLKWLERAPGDVEALSFLGLALNEAGRRDEARALFDFDRFVQIHDIEVPDGFDTLAAFNDALEDHVMAHSTLEVPPEDQPTFHHPSLYITGELLDGSKGPMAKLQLAMNDAVIEYMNDVRQGPAHPFLARPPQQWRLASWAAVLECQGNLEPHIHLDGYLSGVYYARIPKEVRQAQNPGNGEFAGAIEMGRPPSELGCKAPPLTKLVRPKEGMMMLFPASMYHRTIPFEGASRRISIAFDVVPLD